MKPIAETWIRTAQVSNAIFQILFKWMMGVLIRKLLDATFQDNEELVDLTKPTKPLLDFLFLFDLSFFSVAMFAILANAFAVVSFALTVSWSGLRAAQIGQKLRSEILDRAVKASGGSEGGDIARTANNLIVKVRVVEDFVAFDEHLLLESQVVVGLAVTFAIVFAWFGGLIAVGCLVMSKLAADFCERLRRKTVVDIEKNAENVYAHLLDVIKNGVKIKIMGQLSSEHGALTKLEHASTDLRVADAKIKFCREILQQLSLGVIPVLMAMAGWRLISNSDPALAVDIGSSVLVALLLFDEGHKSLVMLAATIDKKTGATEAQAAIDHFLGRDDDTDDDEGDSYESTISRKHTGKNQEITVTFHGDDDTDVEVGAERLPSPHNPGSIWSRKCTDNFTAVTLTNIVYRYPDRDQPALNHYTQSFERGKIHALVGESGSGKSTALKVACDLIRPKSGSIEYWNGMKIAYVSQDQKLFARTVRENVTYGADKNVSDPEIWTALKTANMDKWVESLPNSLDQLLADGEGAVSGGQLQRLNLAHLFCTCQDADLVILDEVLSALDPTSRTILLDELGTFLQGKTALIITHHAEMLEICDSVHEMPSPKLIISCKKLSPSFSSDDISV